jgi:hypothetical protein
LAMTNDPMVRGAVRLMMPAMEQAGHYLLPSARPYSPWATADATSIYILGAPRAAALASETLLLPWSFHCPLLLLLLSGTLGSSVSVGNAMETPCRSSWSQPLAFLVLLTEEEGVCCL